MKIINDLLKTPNDLDPVLEAVNKKRNYELENLKSNLKSIENSITYYEKEVKRYQEDAAKYKKGIEELKDKDNSWTMEDLINSLDQLKKNKNIEWAFITKSFQLIVQTKPLLQYHGIDDKQLDEPVGRYAFKLDLMYGSKSIFPMDFSGKTLYYRHPNMMSSPGDACWGGSFGTNLNTMFKAGEYYNLVDSMITFFSTFPQMPNLHPASYWTNWLEDRVIDFRQNPWIDLKPIYKIGKVTKAKKIDFIINKNIAIPVNPFIGV